MSGILAITDLGSGQGYQDVFDMQKTLHAQRVRGEIPDTLLLLEHRPVYTLGTSASRDHVLFNEESLTKRGIDLVTTSRGGDVTYHGPGQLVGYPIVHLGDLGIKVLEYLTALEEIIIKVASRYGVNVGRDSRNRGVWVGNSKLAALGIRVSRQVTMHGFALNVNTHLSDYSGIVACGLQGVGVTSLQQLSGAAVAMDDVKAAIADAFSTVLKYEVK